MKNEWNNEYNGGSILKIKGDGLSSQVAVSGNGLKLVRGFSPSKKSDIAITWKLQLKIDYAGLRATLRETYSLK